MTTVLIGEALAELAANPGTYRDNVRSMDALTVDRAERVTPMLSALLR